MDVRVEGLHFQRDGRCILDVPSLSFGSGTTTAIFGPNGSGKTTLLRLIAALERPSRGCVRLGNAIASPEPAARQRTAYAFQEAVFLGGTVRANLELGLKLRGIVRAERDARIAKAARECGIAHLMQRPARKLSGGEAQRVNLARALALRAPVTLLDEPLSGLDRIARSQLLDDLPRLLATFATTTILVTHDREEAFRLADDLVILVAGRVHAAGYKGDVYRRPPDRETAELLGYTIVQSRGDCLAVPPGGLHLGHGPVSFELVVERVADMGNHNHLLGTIDGTRVDIRLPAGTCPPASGARVTVAAEHSVVLGEHQR